MKRNGKNGNGKRPHLNDAQERFCLEYLIDLNATAAYSRAYPDATRASAEAAGSRLLGNVKVAARISHLRLEQEERTRITADRVLEELALVAFSDMRAFATWGPDGIELKDSAELSPEQARCISEISESVSKDGGSKKFKLHSKPEALTKLGLYFKLFTERHEMTGRDGKPLIPVAAVQAAVQAALAAEAEE